MALRPTGVRFASSRDDPGTFGAVLPDLPATVIASALEGDRQALRELVDAMTPIIQARVVRGLVRRRTQAAGRDVRQEVEDMTQDVFGALFADGGRVLRAWDPARGLSLANFVGLVADRQVASMMRSGRKNPWRGTPEELDELEAGSDVTPAPESQIQSRHVLALLLERMKASLSTRGLELFQRLYVEDQPIEEVATAMGMDAGSHLCLAQSCRASPSHLRERDRSRTRVRWRRVVAYYF